MIVDYLLIGQGISGTWLSFYLEKEKKSFLVIDNHQPNSASRVAAGIINPVTGRRIVKTWMIDELLSHLIAAYEELGKELGIEGITQKNVIDFHPAPQMKIAFEERLKEDETNLRKPVDENIFRDYFNYDFGFGEVDPCYVINLQEILSSWKKKLETAGNILNEDFNIAELKLNNNAVHYRNLIAEKIIFCDGQASKDNPYFKNLPFSLNKGEALFIESAEIPTTNIFKKGMMLTPIGNNLFWIGSNYLWNFSDDQPTKEFRQQTESFLRNWLKVSYKIADHKAAVRPANIERRPFVGFHPLYDQVGILNGMGTKGCSLAPFFAKQLTEHLVNKTGLSPEANIARFEKILTRN